MTPLSDDRIYVEDGHWPGSTADDFIMFVYQPQYRPNFIEGSKYLVRNQSTMRLLYLFGHYFTTFPYDDGDPALQV